MRTLLLFLFVFLLSGLTSVKAAVDPPEIRCVSLDENDNIRFDWNIPPDPNGEFQAYNIYISNNNVTFNLAGNILTYTQDTFLQNGTFSGIIFYYIETVFDDGSGLDTSVTSDTVSPIVLSVNTSGAETAALNWNPIRSPDLLTQGSFYYIYRRVGSGGTWNLIDSVANTVFTYTDQLDICSDSVFYRIEIRDDLPCTSRSNVAGGQHTKLAPDPPTIDSLSVDPLTGDIIIHWDPNPNDQDIGGYIIVQFLNGVEFKDTIFGIGQTSFIDTSANAGTGSLLYGISAFDTCDALGFGNVSATDVLHQSLFLEVTPEPCDGRNTLVWNADTGNPVGIIAPINILLWGQENGGTPQLIALLSGTDTTFVHDDLAIGSTWTYTAQLVNSNGTSSTSNLVVGALTGPTGPLFHYLNYVTVKTGSGVEVSCYVDTTAAVSGYNFLRSIYPNGPFHVIGQQPDRNLPFVTFLDEEAKYDEHSYYYRVDALDICGVVLEESNVARSIRMAGMVDGGNSLNSLWWNFYDDWSVAGSQVDRYELFRSINGEFGTVPEATFVVDSLYTDDLSFTFGSDGRTCYYLVAYESSTNVYGLQETSTSNVVCLNQPSAVFIPNAFHPGGKGENDSFKPIGRFIDPSDYYFAIHTRWGEKIFETRDLNEGWDGGDFPLSVYVYHVICRTSEGELVNKRGAVTLLR